LDGRQLPAATRRWAVSWGSSSGAHAHHSTSLHHLSSAPPALQNAELEVPLPCLLPWKGIFPGKK